MVEHNDDFGSSPPSPEPSPEGSPGDPSFAAPRPLGETAEYPSPAPSRTHTAPQVHNDSPRQPIFPMVLGAAMIASFVVSWSLNSRLAQSSGTPAGAETAANAAAATPG